MSASCHLRETVSHSDFEAWVRVGFSTEMQHYVTKGVAIDRHNPRKISAEAY